MQLAHLTETDDGRSEPANDLARGQLPLADASANEFQCAARASSPCWRKQWWSCALQQRGARALQQRPHSRHSPSPGVSPCSWSGARPALSVGAAGAGPCLSRRGGDGGRVCHAGGSSTNVVRAIKVLIIIVRIIIIVIQVFVVYTSGTNICICMLFFEENKGTTSRSSGNGNLR